MVNCVCTGRKNGYAVKAEVGKNKYINTIKPKLILPRLRKCNKDENSCDSEA